MTGTNSKVQRNREVESPTEKLQGNHNRLSEYKNTPGIAWPSNDISSDQIHTMKYFSLPQSQSLCYLVSESQYLIQNKLAIHWGEIQGCE